jgi:hypothetical protein
MKTLLEKLRQDKELTNEIKLEMLTEWIEKYSYNMMNNIQSKEELEQSEKTIFLLKKEKERYIS